MTEEKLLCYNKGCGQEYKESDNTPTSCRFHPGEPYFHDAYKGWSCCRKTTDFTEFLNMKGCAVSFHSNVKPPEPEKKQQTINEEVFEAPKPKYVATPRPPPDSPLICLPATLSESMKKQTFVTSNSTSYSNSDDVIKVGVTVCTNKGCKQVYQGPESNDDTCKFHPGVPIFHEGLKYWSCCQKKTTEFDVFLNQEGCQTGSHVWIKPKEEKGDNENSVKCRHDWHQDGLNVEVVIYSGGKKYDSSQSKIHVNGVKLQVELYFPEEKSWFRQTWILVGVVKPELSLVFMSPMKVEVKLRKADAIMWSALEIPQEVYKKDTQTSAEDEHKDVGVDPVDLSDL